MFHSRCQTRVRTSCPESMRTWESSREDTLLVGRIGTLNRTESTPDLLTLRRSIVGEDTSLLFHPGSDLTGTLFPTGLRGSVNEVLTQLT